MASRQARRPPQSSAATASFLAPLQPQPQTYAQAQTAETKTPPPPQQAEPTWQQRALKLQLRQPAHCANGAPTLVELEKERIAAERRKRALQVEEEQAAQAREAESVLARLREGEANARIAAQCTAFDVEDAEEQQGVEEKAEEMAGETKEVAGGRGGDGGGGGGRRGRRPALEFTRELAASHGLGRATWRVGPPVAQRLAPWVPGVGRVSPAAVAFVDDMLAVDDAEQGRIERMAQGSPDWLKSRRHRVGGSQYAAAIGDHPYTTAAQLVDEILHPCFTSNAAMERGSRLEPAACELLERRERLLFKEALDVALLEGADTLVYRGMRVALPDDVGKWPLEEAYRIKHGGSRVYKPAPWMAASTDGDIYIFGRKLGIVEIKSPYLNAVYILPPRYYVPQIQGNMYVHTAYFCLFVTYVTDTPPDELGEPALQTDLFLYDEAYATEYLRPRLDLWYFNSYLPRALADEATTRERRLRLAQREQQRKRRRAPPPANAPPPPPPSLPTHLPPPPRATPPPPRATPPPARQAPPPPPQPNTRPRSRAAPKKRPLSPKQTRATPAKRRGAVGGARTKARRRQAAYGGDESDDIDKGEDADGERGGGDADDFDLGEAELEALDAQLRLSDSATGGMLEWQMGEAAEEDSGGL